MATIEAAKSEWNPAPYDEVSYPSYPFPKTHPDRLATIATLFGLKPANVEHCRVLEIGCASGGNLIPMADLLPESRLDRFAPPTFRELFPKYVPASPSFGKFFRLKVIILYYAGPRYTLNVERISLTQTF